MKDSTISYVDDIHSRVSRTFDLSAKKLSGDLEKDTKIGYLLCRVADTIEDTPILNSEEKTKYLQEYSELFQNNETQKEDIISFQENLLETAKPQSNQKADTDYWELVGNTDKIFQEYNKIPDQIQSDIDDVVAEMSSGMARFEQKNQSRQGQFQIQDIEEYRDYCHIVAGTVGELMTSLFKNYGEYTEEEERVLEKNSGEFGLALQTVNIIKDVKEDIEYEEEYLWPESMLENHGWSHKELEQSLETTGLDREVEPLINSMISLADNYLDSTREYIETLAEASDRNKTNKEILEWASLAALMSEATLREIENDKKHLLTKGDKKASKAETFTIFDKQIDRINEKGYREVAETVRETERSSAWSKTKLTTQLIMKDFRMLRNRKV